MEELEDRKYDRKGTYRTDCFQDAAYKARLGADMKTVENQRKMMGSLHLTRSKVRVG